MARHNLRKSDLQLGQRLERIKLDRLAPAFDRRFVQCLAVGAQACSLGGLTGNHDRTAVLLVRLSSRAQVFTASPMAVMICERGGPMAPTIASLK